MTAKSNALLAPSVCITGCFEFLDRINCRFSTSDWYTIKSSHGEASALMMPHVLKWNFDFSADKCVLLWRDY